MSKPIAEMDDQAELSWWPRAQRVPSTWKLVDFEQAFESISVNKKKIPSKAYLSQGDIPVVDQGQSFVSGYTNNKDSIIDPGETGVIVFGDHTRTFKRITFPFAPGADGVKVLTPVLFDSAYAHYACQTLDFPNKGYSRHFSYLKRCKVPLAPLNEQRRIVEKIETLFARLDQGEAALRHTQQLLARYRQSVLKAAVTGALTADWRAENAHRLEHGRDLLARILQTRRETWQGRGKYKEPAEPDTTDLPELPEGWVWSSLEQLCTLHNGDRGKNYPSKKYFVPEGVPFVNAGHLNDGVIDKSKLDHIPEERFALLRAGHLKKDDLLFCIRGSLGKFALCDIEKGAIASSLVIIRPVGPVLLGYLSAYLSSPFVRGEIGKYDNGSAQPNLAASDLAKFLVPLPTLPEQEQIAAQVAEKQSLITTQHREVSNVESHSAALRQSILKDAFAGKLVPQDPTDEPAADLLARIRASRAATPHKKARA